MYNKIYVYIHICICIVCVYIYIYIYIYLHIKAYTLLILTSSPEKKRNDRWHDRGNHHYIEPLPGRGPSHSRAGSSIGIGRQLKHHWATALDTHLPVAGPPDKLQTFVQVAILGSNMCNPSTNHNRATRGHESGHEGKTITAFICVSVCVCIVHGCMRSCQNKYANRLGANGKPPPAPASRETTTTPPPPPPPAGEAAAARTLRKLPPQHYTFHHAFHHDRPQHRPQCLYTTIHTTSMVDDKGLPAGSSSASCAASNSRDQRHQIEASLIV